NGRDVDRYTPRIGARRDGPVRLAFVGHLTATKRPERFFDLVRAVRARGVDVQAVIAGDGPLLDDVKRSGEAEGVDVLGRVDDVPAVLATSDVFVFTSVAQGEGMPGVLIEAGLSGLPTVTTDVPGAGSVVEDGVTGFVVAIDDFVALTERTLTLVR